MKAEIDEVSSTFPIYQDTGDTLWKPHIQHCGVQFLTDMRPAVI